MYIYMAYVGYDRNNKTMEFLKLIKEIGLLALVQAGGTYKLTLMYRWAWDNDCHTRVPFFSLKKKKKRTRSKNKGI